MHCVCHITLGHIFHKICELEYLMEIIEISNAGKTVSISYWENWQEIRKQKENNTWVNNWKILTEFIGPPHAWLQEMEFIGPIQDVNYKDLFANSEAFLFNNGKVIWVLMFYSLWEFWPPYEHSHLCIYIYMHLKLNVCSSKPITKPGLTSRIFSTMEWLWFGWTVSK